MKTLILDDDPTGTQSASDVTVMLRWTAEAIADELRNADAVYLLTNTRAVDEDSAVALVRRIVDDARRVEKLIGEPIRFVLRGDSTLRGHVFAESEAAGGALPILFVPAYPEGGRTTVDGQHLVRVGGELLPAERTEFAGDPVFGYENGRLDEYVREKSKRTPRLLGTRIVRDPRAIREALRNAVDNDVLLPDVHDDGDIERIAAAVRDVRPERAFVVRSGAPLAAAIADVSSDGLLSAPLARPAGPVLLVCGSHTGAAGRQLAEVERIHGAVFEIDTEAALADPESEGGRIASLVLERLQGSGLAVVSSERVRRPEHDTLAHGEHVMRALMVVVAAVRHLTGTVISKGGITGADVAREGIGADHAVVRGQILAGVSVWGLRSADGDDIVQVVVPGNVGEDDTLVKALRAVGR
ncbi:four-carbon acid sugar kinase family protein [Microbacterium sp.]|uniref:four-carbon acid sugar kinase family protein n=1 Tax=Microbacterium sp. TaxID=51671 RepID=UPI003F97D666